jgi:hypothetical protein
MDGQTLYENGRAGFQYWNSFTRLIVTGSAAYNASGSSPLRKL